MGRYKKDLGDKGEHYAVQYLEDHGFMVIARNYRCKGGEIDIIAQKELELHIIEVKTRTEDNQQTIASSLGESKLRAIHKTTLAYLAENRIAEDIEIIFDLIVIVTTDQGYKVEYSPSFYYPSW